MTTYTLTVGQQLVVQDCCHCGMQFGVAADFDRRRRDDHGGFYCPAGHRQFYTGKSEAQKERERAAQLERRLANEQEHSRSLHARAEAERRKHAATKGQLTKARKRSLAGVCPCCTRSFANVRRHIEGQHPEKLAEIDAASGAAS